MLLDAISGSSSKVGSGVLAGIFLEFSRNVSWNNLRTFRETPQRPIGEISRENLYEILRKAGTAREKVLGVTSGGNIMRKFKEELGKL